LQWIANLQYYVFWSRTHWVGQVHEGRCTSAG
jgi:hypothetical protein